MLGVGVGVGSADQVQRPRCSTKGDDRVFTPLLQLWMRADEDVVRRARACVCERGVGVCSGILWEDPRQRPYTRLPALLHLTLPVKSEATPSQ